jgi:hypothetical protein
LYFVQSYIGRRPTICWFFHMNPILKLLVLLIPCFTMAMSKHQRLWKIIIISHWCLCSWSVEVNDFSLISTQVIKILMLQTILISSRLEPLKIFLETIFFFCLFSINLENVKCQFEMVGCTWGHAFKSGVPRMIMLWNFNSQIKTKWIVSLARLHSQSLPTSPKPYMTILTQTLNVEKEKDACMGKMSDPQKSFRGSTHAWNLCHMHDILCKSSWFTTEESL